MRASAERAALNFLAEANALNGPGVEEREDSVELEVERVRLGLNIDVGRRRRFGPWDCEFEDVVAMLNRGALASLSWESVAISNRENSHRRDLVT